MILSQTKKGKLLSFIKSHYVDYHDVRLLIARDLEEDISKQMKEDEALSFDDALKRAYKTYGVIGFSDASEAYMKKINTYFYKKVILKMLRDEGSTIRFWVFSALSFLIIYTVISTLDSKPFVLAAVFTGLIILGLIFYFRKLHLGIKKLKKEGQYSYFDQLLVSNNSVLFPFTYLPLVMAPHIGSFTETRIETIVVLSFFTLISAMAFYLIYFKLYKNRPELLKAYQEHFLSDKLSTHSNLSKSNSE